MSCDVGEATEGLENELWRRLKRRKGWRMSCDVGEVTERLENEQRMSPALQSHYLLGRELNFGSQTYFFDHTRTRRASAQCRGHLRDSTNMKDDTHQAHSFIPTRRIWNDDYGGQMIFGYLVGLKFPDICLTGEQKPRKNSSSKLVLTGDRTRARCVTGAYATACSTAVGSNYISV